MDNKKIKNIVIAILVLIIIVLITVIVLVGTNNNEKMNNEGNKMQETKESEKVDKVDVNLDDYKGKWYLDENSIGQDASYIEIKGVENNKIKVYGYICRITELGDFDIEIDGNTGTFTIIGEQITGPLMYGDEAEISGEIKFDNNKVILAIVDTNVAYLEKFYTFSYKSGTKQEIDMSKYKGKWYLDENSIGQNASYIEIKGVENNKIKAYGYICRITELGDFDIEIDGNTGTFTIIGEQITGPLMYGDEAEILGEIKFDNNKVILAIVDTNVAYLEKFYTFSYKG